MRHFFGGQIILIACFLLLILFCQQFLFPAVVNASFIEEEEFFVGLGVAVLIYIIARLGKEYLSGDIEAPTVPSDDDDLELLAHIINGEARGEPYIGQVAVGAVVMNRVKCPDFPNTVKEVIMAPGQFSAVSDGQFYLEPTESAYRAAREALAGKDPTNGALYFFNPRTARNLSWFLQLQETITIGNHVFAVD